jgi:hypothetical protein
MASEIIVNTIKAPTTGANANKIIVGSGQELDASAGLITPSGHVIQTSAESRVNDLQISINNSSVNTAITQLTSTITPIKASSRIKVDLHTQAYAPSGQYLGFMIFRSVDGGSYTGTHGKPHAFIGALSGWQDIHISIIDSPTYTLGNAISYRPYVYTYNTSATTYFGWGSSAGGSVSSMYAQEIAQ